MASFTKWLGAGLGWSFGGPIGALLGYIVGNAIDGFSKKDIQDFREQASHHDNVTHSGDFEVSLLILSSFVIKADGKIDQRELDFVRAYFVKMYGKDRANHAFRLFKGIIKSNDVSVRQISLQIRQQMQHASRLQLVHYLFALAKADEIVTPDELDMLHKIAGYLSINPHDFESIKAMFYNDSESAYKILEIEKAVTDKEVKAAYRKMVKKHHPDKVKHLGEEHVKGAQEKFLKIQEAYEQIKKERGLS
ncbi:TerB family tellurite resistance protein [Flavicella sp.]|uniref:TerB family tellurite resistance protein n=1 Tax=Flavicella sp. TaxID=2957742 RepID=UPI00261EF054|nr:TerB family tellurite resistance protein [Flavicella sp.]MDG1804569.1 TerB family tellurite resistance protein [Flavicella sp.]MDG2281123.1 TerB family tellurite resistance protein [Flavicella sp.]